MLRYESSAQKSSYCLSRRPDLLAIAVFVLAVMVTSCSASTDGTAKNLNSAAVSASPRETAGAVTVVPAASPPPFHQIAPVAHRAGSMPAVSQHWVGYTFPAHHVTGVRAEWTEPTVRGDAGAEEFVWIGVGGWAQAISNIIQDGTFVFFPHSGGIHEGIWYQRIPPQQKAVFPLVGVSPGEHIYASVVRLPRTHNKWRLSVDDTTNESAFTIAPKFHSLGSYPTFVVEDPNLGPVGPVGPFYPFPHWASVTFSNIQVRVRGTWIAAAALPAIRIDMVRSGKVLATASPLSRRSSFSAIQR